MSGNVIPPYFVGFEVDICVASAHSCVMFGVTSCTLRQGGFPMLTESYVSSPNRFGVSLLGLLSQATRLRTLLVFGLSRFCLPHSPRNNDHSA